MVHSIYSLECTKVILGKIENCVISSNGPPKSHFQPRGAVEGVLNQRSSEQTKENQATQGLVFCVRPLPSDWTEGLVHRNRELVMVGA